MHTATTRHAKLLQKIDRIFGSTYDLHKVIKKIYKEIGKVLDTSNFYIAMYHRLENAISFEIYTIEGREIHPRSRTLSKGLTEYVIRAKKPVRIDKNYRKFCKRLGIKPRGKDAKSWLGVPMIYKNRVEGVINIQDYKREKVYSHEDEAFVQSIANRAAVVVANTRLLEQEMRRSQELMLLNQIAQRLTTSLDVNKICDAVIQSIKRNFKQYNVRIFIVRNGEITLKKHSGGFRDSVSKKLRCKIEQNITDAFAREARTIIANDVSKSTLYRGYKQTRVKSATAIPLTISEETIGVLHTECSDVNAFSDNTVRILELIADRLGVALHNARLYESADNHAKELAVSSTIFAQSLISTELDDLLNEIVEVIGKTFGYTNCALFLVDRETKKLYIKAAHGYEEQMERKITLEIGKEGMCGHVAETGKLYYAPDVSKDRYYLADKKEIQSGAAAPLTIRREVIGVLYIESEKLNAFTDRDLRMFTVFASQAAIVIENARLFGVTKTLSLTDALTKAANRRHFDLMLDRELKKAKGYSRPLSLAMIDLDDFKKFNDKYGHIAGDKVLVQVTKALRKNVRDTDFLARYGGEEFALILPETSNHFAFEVADRVRSAVEALSFTIRGVGKKHITVSIGVATYPNHAQVLTELIDAADKALYQAKQKGKNTVETL